MVGGPVLDCGSRGLRQRSASLRSGISGDAGAENRQPVTTGHVILSRAICPDHASGSTRLPFAGGYAVGLLPDAAPPTVGRPRGQVSVASSGTERVSTQWLTSCCPSSQSDTVRSRAASSGSGASPTRSTAATTNSSGVARRSDQHNRFCRGETTRRGRGKGHPGSEAKAHSFG